MLRPLIQPQANANVKLVLVATLQSLVERGNFANWLLELAAKPANLAIVVANAPFGLLHVLKNMTQSVGAMARHTRMNVTLTLWEQAFLL